MRKMTERSSVERAARVRVASRQKGAVLRQTRPLALHARPAEDESMGNGLKMGDGIAAIALGDTLLVLWQEPATLERWQWQLQLQRELLETHPAGIVCLVMILPGSSAPNAAVRARMQQDFRGLGTNLRRLVALPLGDTLWLSVVRAMLRAILLVSGMSKQHAVVSRLSEALDEIEKAAGPNTRTRGELRAAAIRLCSALGVTVSEAA